MRALVNMIVAAITLAVSAAQVEAAPAPASAPQQSQSLTQLIQGEGYEFGPGRRACAEGYHYACWVEPYGRRICGCWPGGDRPACPVGYRYDCRLTHEGYRRCGCY